MKQKKENNGKTEEDSRTVLRGELALLIVVLINSLGVVYFPGASGRKPDDPAEKVCSPVSLQLRGGLCLQRNAGCT